MNFNMENAMTTDSALAHQEGGRHYKDMKIQPVEYIHANSIGYFEGNVIKYVSRHRAKNGVEDLKKARHYLDLLIEMETRTSPRVLFIAREPVSAVSGVSSMKPPFPIPPEGSEHWTKL